MLQTIKEAALQGPQSPLVYQDQIRAKPSPLQMEGHKYLLGNEQRPSMLLNLNTGSQRRTPKMEQKPDATSWIRSSLGLEDTDD